MNIYHTEADLIEFYRNEPNNESAVCGPDSNQKSFSNSWRWGAGCLLVLGGLTCGNLLMLLVWVGMGCILIPPTARMIEEKWNVELNKNRLTQFLVAGGIATLVVAAMMAGATTPGDEGGDYDKWINRVGAIGSPMP